LASPGGIVETGESPLDGAAREIKEELGINPQYLNFAGVDFVAPPKSEKYDKTFDFLHVFFSGGYLSKDEIAAIQLQESELKDMKFVELDELDQFANEHQAKRIRQFIATNKMPLFLDEGRFASKTNPAFEAYQYTKIAGAALIKKDDKFLLVQEMQPSAYGKWHFPAGGVDIGETVQHATIREVAEETGLNATLGEELIVLHERGVGSVLHVYLVEEFSGEERPQEGEIMSLEWFSREEIMNMHEKLRYPSEIYKTMEAYDRYSEHSS
jgi:ADP-ribose pyrophosphatase YjhB (NUDIX family)